MPIIKFIFKDVIDESETDGKVKSFDDMPLYFWTFFPIISENKRGVPHPLQIQQILVFNPNLKLKRALPAALKQFPVFDAKEKVLLPPIVKVLETL